MRDNNDRSFCNLYRLNNAETSLSGDERFSRIVGEPRKIRTFFEFYDLLRYTGKYPIYIYIYIC